MSSPQLSRTNYFRAARFHRAILIPLVAIAAEGKYVASSELLATQDGTSAGWNSNVDAATAVIAVDNSVMGAVYKCLAIGFNESGAFLFATNFASGTIDVFNAEFHQVNK